MDMVTAEADISSKPRDITSSSWRERDELKLLIVDSEMLKS
jgi:hypothetical protein